jgi:hypothetical protein
LEFQIDYPHQEFVDPLLILLGRLAQLQPPYFWSSLDSEKRKENFHSKTASEA